MPPNTPTNARPHQPTGDRCRVLAEHSGLSLTASADGKVVQATDTGAATQRWSATAN